jgi:hypothetical protein
MKKEYKMNFATQTITITKEFAEKMLETNSEEANFVKNLREVCPDLKIKYKTHKGSKNATKGLTYDKMRNYIMLYSNAGELLVLFEKVVTIGNLQNNSFAYVYKWFKSQFPNYNELPEFVDGELYAKPIGFPEERELAAASAPEIAKAA